MVVEDEKEKTGKIKDTIARESNIDPPPVKLSTGYPWIDVRCELVIDFLHAQVFTHSFQVYGYIKTVDLQGSINFPAYDRHQFQSPQRLYLSSQLGNFLRFSGPQEISTLNEPIVLVRINDVDTGAVIAHAQQHLLKSTQYPSTFDYDFEKLFTLNF